MGADKKMKKDFICIKDLTPEEISDIFVLAHDLKQDKSKFGSALSGKTLALIFQKPSNRTRVSFEVGMCQLGGYSIYLGPEEINLGVRESIKDVAKTLSRYVDIIVLRTFAHDNLLEMAKHASIPVINGLSDLLHPCQALADIYTVKEQLGRLKGLTLAYIGDGNNVCHSLLYGSAKVGMNMNLAVPKGYQPQDFILREAKSLAQKSGAKINLFSKPEEAVKNADVIYTDVWASMGQEKEAKKRKAAFKRYQINKKLLSQAKRGCLIMHCLPAHRGEEITDEVIDSKHSIVFDQAENRLHVQKAILIKLLG
jgi:ornithine carbamoyltransferase